MNKTDTLLCDVLSQYALERLQLRPRTVQAYGYSLGAFQRWLKRAPTLSDLNKTTLLEFLRDRLREVSPRTVHRERQDLLMLWRFAADLEMLTPPPRITRVRLPDPEPEAWTAEEVGRIIEAVGKLRGPTKAHWLAFIKLLYYTGCRVGAAMAITWTDCDLARSVLVLRSDAAKTGQSQTLRLHPCVVEALGALPRRSEKVFPWRDRRSPYRTWRRLLRIAGLADGRKSGFHRVRRTTYTLLTGLGSAEIASWQLGHRTNMSRHYLDMRLIERQQAADLLPAPVAAKSLDDNQRRVGL